MATKLAAKPKQPAAAKTKAPKAGGAAGDGAGGLKKDLMAKGTPADKPPVSTPKPGDLPAPPMPGSTEAGKPRNEVQAEKQAKAEAAAEKKSTVKKGSKDDKPRPLVDGVVSAEERAPRQLPDKKKLKKGVDDLNTLKKKSASVGGEKSALLKELVEHENVHKEALTLVARLHSLEPEGQSAFLRHFDYYREVFELKIQPDLFD